MKGQEQEAETNIVRGTVKWFDDQKGWGFIQCDKGAVCDAAFVHFSEIRSHETRRRLFEGQRVELTPMLTPKGWRATSVSAIGNESDAARQQ